MIKNIIFDFGGVLLDLDYNKTFHQLSDVMGVDMEYNDLPAHIFKIMLGYEKGEINTETFLWNLQKASKNLTPQPDVLIKAWNAMLLGWNPDRFEFLLDVKNIYKTFLLSNTNDLHLKWVRRDLEKTHKITDFDTKYFEQTYFSHEMIMRKPEPQIYISVLEKNGLIAEETLFIDDNAENINAANKIGIMGILHDPKTEIIDMLPQYLEDCKK